MKWIDLTAYDLTLMAVRLPSGADVLVLKGADQRQVEAKKLDFHKDRGSGLWIRKGATIKMSEVAGVLPAARVINDAAPSEFFLNLQQRTPSADRPEEPEEKSLEVLLSQATYIGRNVSRAQVYEDTNGRFYVHEPDSQIVRETDDSGSVGDFLRARDAASIRRCADALVAGLADGETLRIQGYEKFVSHIFEADDTDTVSPEDKDRFLLSVQAGIAAYIDDHASRTTMRERFEIASRIFEAAQFMHGNALSISTPLAVVLSRVLTTSTLGSARIDLDHEASCALAAHLPGSASVRLGSTDQGTLDRLQETLGKSRRKWFDAAPGDQGEGASVSCLPHSVVDAPVDLDGYRVTRGDFAEIVERLNNRSKGGRSIFILQGPFNEEDAARHEALHRWIARRYALEGVADIEGTLIGEPGDPPQRILAVGQRRPDMLEEIPEAAMRVRAVDALPDLWTWGSSVIAANAKVAEFYADQPEPGIFDDETDLQVNAYQAPYRPASKVGEASTMVPRNLEGAIRNALSRIVQKYGDIDEFVARNIYMSRAQLQRCFSPEQVDAIAMAIDSMDTRMAFLLADQTGIGKGRIQAALMRKAIMEGRRVLFLTERAINLSDIWRDLIHIETDQEIAPLIFHRSGVIKDEITGEELIEPPSKEEFTALLEEGVWPEGNNAIFSLYSMFNGKPDESVNAALLANIIDGDIVVFADECHVAASGVSNTSRNITNAIDNAGQVCFSSATWAKDARNMQFYRRLFPADSDIDLDHLNDIVAEGGETLQEVLSVMLAEDGVMIRREHDLSRLVVNYVVDTTYADRNRGIVDAVAPVLNAMAFLSGDLDDRVVRANRIEDLRVEAEADRLRRPPERIPRMQLKRVSFGSPLYMVHRMLLASLNVDQSVDRALSALRENRKPILVVESTGESLVNWIEREEGGINGYMTIKDMLRKVLHRMEVVRRVNNGVEEEIPVTELHPECAPTFAHIHQLIDDLPDIPVSAIDMLRDRLTAEGYSVGEITGRKREIRDGQRQQRENTDKFDIKNGFNHGQLDALITNTSGSTGIDLHAGPRFKDQRQRQMIVVETFSDPLRMMQMLGRMNRFGQVVDPILDMTSLGLPMGQRLDAMYNAKLRRLSANITSNRESAALIEDVPDLINTIGDMVCARYAEARPDLVQRLGLPVSHHLQNDEALQEESALDAADTRRSANEFLARLCMLPCDMQEQVIEELVAEYEALVEELDARGENPLKTLALPGRVQIREKRVFEGIDTEIQRSSFDAPVYLIHGAQTVEVEPVRSDDLLEEIEKGVRRLGADSPQRLGDRLQRQRRDLLKIYLPNGGNVPDFDEAVQADPIAHRFAGELDRFIDALHKLEIGSKITFMDEGVEEVAIVTGVRYGKRGFEHLPSKLHIEAYPPGADRARAFNMRSLLADPFFKVEPGMNGPEADELCDFYDEAGDATRVRAVQLLSGNLFRAMELNLRYKLGKLAVYETEEGVRTRALVVNKKHMNALDFMPTRVPNTEVAAELIHDHQRSLHSSSDLKGQGITVKVHRGNILCSFPPLVTQKYPDLYEEGGSMLALLREFQPAEYNPRATMKIDVTDRDDLLRRFIAGAYEAGYPLFASTRDRDLVNEIAARHVQEQLAENTIEAVA